MARVRFLELTPYVGLVCCWFASQLRGFFSRYSGFPRSKKTNISKFKFNLETVSEKPLCGCAIEITIYLFYVFYFTAFDGERTHSQYRLESRLYGTTFIQLTDLWHPPQIVQGRMTSPPTWQRRESLGSRSSNSLPNV